jgi:hypothetical protein
VTGKGLADAVRGTDVAVDVTEAPSRARPADPQFSGSATANLPAPVRMRPVSAADAAAEPAQVAAGPPLSGAVRSERSPLPGPDAQPGHAAFARWPALR